MDKKVTSSAPARKSVAKSAVRKTQPIRGAKGQLMGSTSLNEGKDKIPTQSMRQPTLPLPNRLANDNQALVFSSQYTEAYKAYQRIRSDGVPLFVKDFAQTINDEMDDIWFSFIDKTIQEETFVTLKDYKEGLVSSNIDLSDLCSELKDMWIEQLSREYPEWHLEVVVLKYQTYNGKTKRKVANILRGPDGLEWVVDYSARELDNRAPFPLVQPFPLWRAWVNKHLEEHGDEPNGMERFA